MACRDRAPTACVFFRATVQSARPVCRPRPPAQGRMGSLRRRASATPTSAPGPSAAGPEYRCRWSHGSIARRRPAVSGSSRRRRAQPVLPRIPSRPGFSGGRRRTRSRPSRHRLFCQTRWVTAFHPLMSPLRSLPIRVWSRSGHWPDRKPAGGGPSYRSTMAPRYSQGPWRMKQNCSTSCVLTRC